MRVRLFSRAAALSLFIGIGLRFAQPSIARLAYEAFLPSLEDQALRDAFWEIFQKAEVEAEKFLPPGQEEIILTKVLKSDQVGQWRPNGELVMAPKTADKGVLFHELFHPVFHVSQLHRGNDRLWGEGFCDAFRYFMEERLLPGTPSRWKRGIDARLEWSDDRIREEIRTSLIGKYWGSAALVIKKSNRNYEDFIKLWARLCQARKEKNADVLDDYLGFAMKSEGKANPGTTGVKAPDVPSFFYFNYAGRLDPGKRLWLRVDQDTWIERYPSGSETRFEAVGRMGVDGDAGTVVSRLDAKTGKQTPFQAFIPDKGGKKMQFRFRFTPQDNRWRNLGPMKGVQ